MGRALWDSQDPANLIPGYGRFLLVFGFAMGSDRAAFADGCARQEAGGRPPGAERDRPRAQMRRALGGLRRCLWTEEDTLQSLCALGRARHLGGYLQCAGRTQDTLDWLFIDSSCIKVHRCAGGGKGGPWLIGHTKGGRNTKLHAVCDEKGRPCVLLLTSGTVHDCKVAQRCIEAMPPSTELVADKGYDSQALREWLDARGTEAVIPPRKTRKTQYNYD